jgi:hypothetical protein
MKINCNIYTQHPNCDDFKMEATGSDEINKEIEIFKKLNELIEKMSTSQEVKIGTAVAFAVFYIGKKLYEHFGPYRGRTYRVTAGNQVDYDPEAANGSNGTN